MQVHFVASCSSYVVCTEAVSLIMLHTLLRSDNHGFLVGISFYTSWRFFFTYVICGVTHKNNLCTISFQIVYESVEHFIRYKNQKPLNLIQADSVMPWT